ncbi:MAG TPA: hypothetical protein VLT36_20475, partial [Candidatus Dormibacteraeota bacterium]|nr:hypothetical protein [Candidatus Dormibacteraeota bacterium]
HGSTFADSFVELTTRTINNGTQPAAIGVRYLWDYQIGNDDGPEFQPLTPDGSVLTHEATFSAPSFTDYVMADNDVNPNPPTLRIVGTVNGPGFISPTPTAPDLLQYACWGNSSGYAFDYLVDSNIDIATVNSNCQSGNDTGDCAVLYFFGADAPHAMTIAPGQTNTVSASLFARSPATRITGLSRAGTDSILNFLTISNAHYEVQTTTDLVNSVWSTIAPNVIGTGGIVTNIHSSGATNSKRFYRVGSQF